MVPLEDDEAGSSVDSGFSSGLDVDPDLEALRLLLERLLLRPLLPSRFLRRSARSSSVDMGELASTLA